MPSKKKPKSLSDLCTRRVANIAEYACKAIEVFYGNYENSKCRQEIDILRNYFIENIGLLFENVCSEINQLTRHVPTDLRILLDFLFYKNKQMIRLPKLVNQNIIVHLPSTFWAEQLGAMKRITTLDIFQIKCTDNIIGAIIDNCTNLERLHFYASKDGLTDAGLLLLTNCSKLLIIHEYIQFYTSAISADTIQLLVVGLPRLVDINYHSMGAVLSSGLENMILPLRSVGEDTAEEQHLEAIVQLCPSLERLSLKMSTSSSDEILKPLKSSNLKVLRLELRCFPSANVSPLLNEKGKFLRKLTITNPGIYNTKEDITLIGLNCPLLEHLSWVTFGNTDELYVGNPYKMSQQEKQQIFMNLDTLHLRVSASHFNHGIPQLCLLNAFNIKDIVLIVKDPHNTCKDLHEIMQEILLKNTMKHLTYFKIRGSNSLITSETSLEIIFTYLHNLTKLVYISKMNAEVVKYFKFMETEILKNNLSLELSWRNLEDTEQNAAVEDVQVYVDPAVTIWALWLAAD